MFFQMRASIFSVKEKTRSCAKCEGIGGGGERFDDNGSVNSQEKHDRLTG